METEWIFFLGMIAGTIALLFLEYISKQNNNKKAKCNNKKYKPILIIKIPSDSVIDVEAQKEYLKDSFYTFVIQDDNIKEISFEVIENRKHKDCIKKPRPITTTQGRL